MLLDDVLRTYQNKYSVQDVRDEVVSNTKQRLGLREDADGTIYIRANQGHTLKGLDEHALLQPVKSAGEVPVCLHGTYAEVLPLILETGLSRMQRNHIHFARGLPEGDTGVISGMRSSCQVPATRCSPCRWGWVLGGLTLRARLRGLAGVLTAGAHGARTFGRCWYTWTWRAPWRRESSSS